MTYFITLSIMNGETLKNFKKKCRDRDQKYSVIAQKLMQGYIDGRFRVE